MSKRKKYNSKNRIKALVKGASIRYDGEENFINGRMANGVGMNQTVFDYLREKKFRWHIELKVAAQYGDLVRHADVEFTTDQEVNINDMTDTVHDLQTSAMLEMPGSYQFKHMHWKATVL